MKNMDKALQLSNFDRLSSDGNSQDTIYKLNITTSYYCTACMLDSYSYRPFLPYHS